MSDTIFQLEDMVSETKDAIDEINLLCAIAADAIKMRRAAKLQKKHWHQDLDQVSGQMGDIPPLLKLS